MGLKNTTVRQLTDEDMLEISEWFANRRWSQPPRRHMLPETGYVAEREGKLLSVAWLYITNSSIGIVDWVATSPDAGYRGLASLVNLMDHIELVSKDDTQAWLHFTGNRKLAEYLKKKCRFKIGERDINLGVRSAR